MNAKILIMVMFTFCISALAQDVANLAVISSENIDSIVELTSLERDGIITQIDWSPNGKRLGLVVHYEDEQVVELWDFDEESIAFKLTSTITPINVSAFRWSPNSQIILTEALGNKAYVATWDADTGNLIDTLLNTTMIVEKCCDPPISPIVGWNNDFTIAAIRQDAHTVEISDLGVFEFRFPESLLSETYIEVPNYGSIASAKWSPNGNFIAIVHADGTPSYKFHIIDASTLETVLFAYGPDYWICNILWSPDESTLAVASEWLSAGSGTQSTNVRFYTIGEPVTYGNEVILSEDSLINGRCQSALAWSPDSQIITIGFPTGFRSYDSSDFTELSYIEEIDISGLSWHPSGKIIASGNIAGVIQLWSVGSD